MNYYRCNVLDSSLLNLPTWKTISGDIATFNTSYTNPLRSCVAQIVAQQAGSGDASPSNVRAISGVDEVNIHKLGINLWDEQWELGVFDTSTGADVEASNRIRAKNKIRVKGGTYISFHSPLSGSNEGLWVIFFDANESAVSGLSFPNCTDHYGNSFMFHSTTILIPQNVAYLRFYVTYQYGTTYQNDISINASKTDITYHAYTDTVTTVTLPETIYGGNIDVISGSGSKTFDALTSLATAEWSAQGSGDSEFFVASISGIDVSRLNELLCNKYKTLTPTISNTDDNIIGVISSGAYLRIRDKRYTASTINDFKTSLADCVVIYPLATPTTLTTSATSIPTLSGTNNIYADSGNISVTAEMTLQEYINQQ